jgi:hypothetical protein
LLRLLTKIFFFDILCIKHHHHNSNYYEHADNKCKQLFYHFIQYDEHFIIIFKGDQVGDAHNINTTPITKGTQMN